MIAKSQPADLWRNAGTLWLGAMRDCTDTSFEYWRDCLDVRTTGDYLDVQAFYVEKQMKTLANLLSGGGAMVEKEAGELE